MQPAHNSFLVQISIKKQYIVPTIYYTPRGVCTGSRNHYYYYDLHGGMDAAEISNVYTNAPKVLALKIKF